MERATLSIPAISCGHCVMAIKNELSEIEGIISVEGTPESKQVTVQWNAPADLAQIKTALQEINYPVE